MPGKWRWLVPALSITAGTWTGGCASSSPDVLLQDPQARARSAAADSLLLSVDRTDYARDWLGLYEGLADVFARDKRWDPGRPAELSIWYGQRTSDGRPTITIAGESSRSNGTGAPFGLRDLEVLGQGSLEGVLGGGRPADERLPRHRRKIEYALSRSGVTITGHVSEYWGATDYGPFELQYEWIFEVTKTPATSYNSHRRRWE